MRAATLKRFVRLPEFAEHLALNRLDCLASNRNLEAYEFIQDYVRRTPPDVVHPAKLLTGDDLLGMGFRPGPAIGKILATVEEAQLDGELADRNQAISFVERHFAIERENQEEGRGRRRSSQPLV